MTLHLAVSIDQPGVYEPAPYAESALLAERGALDFVTLGDSFGRPGADALAVLARVAPGTARIGLVPTVTTTHTEPFHVQAAVATLDWVSHGRAGWTVDVSATEAEARLFGRRHAAPPGELWREAGEVADVAARLWDSWEDDAEIRDVATGRFIDRDKLHYVDFEGGTFSVRGPSIVPRPPQGHPVTVVDATAPHARDTAARYADVALVRATGLAGADAARAELRAAAAEFGRAPDSLKVLADLTVDLGDGEAVVDLAERIASWHASGAVDGFHLRPAEPRRDLERIVNGTVALLQHRGLFRTFYPGSTLRDHLDLARPANRYAALSGDRHE
ncbi:LLM class flavin-dependent oxidoreductase [Streptomyces sp. MZ04]|uniref:LLM class flavin-dependent oxidoreductase n=1 Tax=Streptomyces sp. MZ04 TaxID=2559236 RepID=UPI00107EA997|nr:LLM class flavin-dependent oxidoreductase [Streptomyces sp. MZ04]TGB11053.1 LLM class flavin-dependent oxidoreductase [Streptomyces sp. MZ04]